MKPMYKKVANPKIAITAVDSIMLPKTDTTSKYILIAITNNAMVQAITCKHTRDVTLRNTDETLD